jgi:hypothetical protein
MPKRPGPNTPAGRAAMRLNALKHGLTSRSPIIPGIEDEDEWLRHCDGIVETLAPEGYFEEVLAKRIASVTWRLNRVNVHEIAATMKYIERTADDLAIAANHLADPLPEGEIHEPELYAVREERARRVLPAKHDIELTMRFEAHLQRQWVQTLHELQVLQAHRRGERPHLMRFDVNATLAG